MDAYVSSSNDCHIVIAIRGEVDLSDSEQLAVKGTYIFGRAANQRIEVTIDNAQATWTRSGMSGRPLFHLGNLLFHPLGAPDVQIRFTQSPSAGDAPASATQTPTVTMTVTDSTLVLTATRKPEK